MCSELGLFLLRRSQSQGIYECVCNCNIECSEVRNAGGNLFGEKMEGFFYQLSGGSFLVEELVVLTEGSKEWMFSEAATGIKVVK